MQVTGSMSPVVQQACFVSVFILSAGRTRRGLVVYFEFIHVALMGPLRG
jgi:hypothetical protein